MRVHKGQRKGLHGPNTIDINGIWALTCGCLDPGLEKQNSAKAAKRLKKTSRVWGLGFKQLRVQSLGFPG